MSFKNYVYSQSISHITYIDQQLHFYKNYEFDDYYAQKIDNPIVFDTCPICLDDKDVIQLPCHHKICQKCQQLIQNELCPICRQTMFNYTIQEFPLYQLPQEMYFQSIEDIKNYLINQNINNIQIDLEPIGIKSYKSDLTNYVYDEITYYIRQLPLKVKTFIRYNKCYPDCINALYLDEDNYVILHYDYSIEVHGQVPQAFYDWMKSQIYCLENKHVNQFEYINKMVFNRENPYFTENIQFITYDGKTFYDSINHKEYTVDQVKKGFSFEYELDEFDLILLDNDDFMKFFINKYQSNAWFITEYILHKTKFISYLEYDGIYDSVNWDLLNYSDIKQGGNYVQFVLTPYHIKGISPYRYYDLLSQRLYPREFLFSIINGEIVFEEIIGKQQINDIVQELQEE